MLPKTADNVSKIIGIIAKQINTAKLELLTRFCFVISSFAIPIMQVT